LKIIKLCFENTQDRPWEKLAIHAPSSLPSTETSATLQSSYTIRAKEVKFNIPEFLGQLNFQNFEIRFPNGTSHRKILQTKTEFKDPFNS
jgi:hypothetical protein